MTVVKVKRPKCPYCKSRKTQKRGMEVSISRGKQQRWKCSECGHTFYAGQKVKKVEKGEREE